MLKARGPQASLLATLNTNLTAILPCVARARAARPPLKPLLAIFRTEAANGLGEDSFPFACRQSHGQRFVLCPTGRAPFSAGGGPPAIKGIAHFPYRKTHYCIGCADSMGFPPVLSEGGDAAPLVKRLRATRRPMHCQRAAPLPSIHVSSKFTSHEF